MSLGRVRGADKILGKILLTLLDSRKKLGVPTCREAIGFLLTAPAKTLPCVGAGYNPNGEPCTLPHFDHSPCQLEILSSVWPCSSMAASRPPSRAMFIASEWCTIASATFKAEMPAIRASPASARISILSITG